MLDDADAVAARGASVLAAAARDAVEARGAFALAVSGGSTPWAMLAAVATERVPWHAVTVFQVDERVAPPGDDERNLTHLQAALPDEADVRPMPVEDDDLEAAAARYAASLPRRLDLVHLGLGTDGHTASLVPGDPVLDVTDRSVAATDVYQGRRRLTLTYPALERARLALWLVTGADKRGVLAELRSGRASFPAARVATTAQLLLADRAAAGEA